MPMMMTRRGIGLGLVAAGCSSRAVAAARVLRLSHAFPGGTAESGDFRDRLARRFAAAVALGTSGALACQVFPDATLLRPADQFAALAEGRVELALFTLADAAAAIPALDIALMPGLVTGYDRAAQWKSAPIGQALDRLLARRGVLIVCWIWQALGVAGRTRIVLAPDDARGLLIRGGAPSLDLLLGRAGARRAELPAEEVYAAFQGGRLDGCILSATGMISARLQEVARDVTAVSDCFGFALCPLLMARSTFDSLPPDQQAAIMASGAALEPFARQEAEADDARLRDLYLAASTPVQEINPVNHALWAALSSEVQAAYAHRSPECEQFLALGK